MLTAVDRVTRLGVKDGISKCAPKTRCKSRTMHLKVIIDGSKAFEAAEELIGLPSIHAIIEPAVEDQKADIITVTTTIISLVGGSLAIAEQIYKWYKRCRDIRAHQLFNVSIETENGRYILSRISMSDLRQIINDIE